MIKKIIVSETSAGVDLTGLSNEWQGTIDELMNTLDQNDVFYTLVNVNDLPLSKYRDAWMFDDKKTKITVDMQKAKEIKKHILRVEREPLFAKLDIDYQRADEENNTEKKAEIIIEKQALRNVTNKIDAMKTLEELEAVTL